MLLPVSDVSEMYFKLITFIFISVCTNLASICSKNLTNWENCVSKTYSIEEFCPSLRLPVYFACHSIVFLLTIISRTVTFEMEWVSNEKIIFLWIGVSTVWQRNIIFMSQERVVQIIRNCSKIKCGWVTCFVSIGKNSLKAMN